MNDPRITCDRPYLECSMEVLSDLENANILGHIMAHHDEFEGNPKAYTTFFLKVAPFKGQVTNSRCDTSMSWLTSLYMRRMGVMMKRKVKI